MKHLVVDTETSGLYPSRHKVLTVGLLAVDVDHEKLKVLGSSHLPIKHDSYNADPKALAVNKIDLVKHDKLALQPKVVCDKINVFAKKHGVVDAPLLGHNIGFDTSFLRPLFSSVEVEPLFSSSVVDTMHVWNALKRKGLVDASLRSNLGSVAGFFGVDYAKAHDALADCEITAKVYHKMLSLSQ